MLRRALYAAVLVMWANYPIFQIMALTMMSIVMLIYIMLVKPYDDRRLNRMEVFNELTVLMCAWHLLLFTDMITDTDVKWMAGWSMVLITGFNLIFNIGLVLTLSLVTIK